MIHDKHIAHCGLEGFGPFARVGVTFAVQNGDSFAIARPVQFETVDPTAVPPAPTVSLQRDAAQQLMDELWRIGVRPTEGSGSAGAMAAVERHLADVRAIAFHKLNLAAPK